MSEEVQTVVLTAKQARDLIDELPNSFDILSAALDLAQAPVFTGQEKRTIVEIVIEGRGDD